LQDLNAARTDASIEDMGDVADWLGMENRNKPGANGASGSQQQVAPAV
jgi:hypothetical protein